MEWTNADEVLQFLGQEGRRFEIGDRLMLPDIAQPYEVIGIRSLKRGRRQWLFLDFVSTCAVDGCEEEFVFSREVRQWRDGGLYLTRCCDTHRATGWRTPEPMAWKTSEQRREIARGHGIRENTLAAAMLKRQAAARERMGVVEREVLAAVEALSVVHDVVRAEMLTQAVMAQLDPPAGRDTRRQRIVRARDSLVRSKRLKFSPQYGLEIPNANE